VYSASGAGNADQCKSACFTGTKVRILTQIVVLQGRDPQRLPAYTLQTPRELLLENRREFKKELHARLEWYYSSGGDVLLIGPPGSSDKRDTATPSTTTTAKSVEQGLQAAGSESASSVCDGEEEKEKEEEEEEEETRQPAREQVVGAGRDRVKGQRVKDGERRGRGSGGAVQEPGTEFTCFISTKVQILTPEELQEHVSADPERNLEEEIRKGGRVVNRCRY
jgi:hypothetical protein